MLMPVLMLCVAAVGCSARAFLHLDKRPLWDDLRVILGGGGNSTVFLYGADALVVDPKMLGFADEVRRTVEEDLGRQVKRLLLTHSHFDHAAGATEYGAVGAVLAHPNTRTRLVGVSGPCGRTGTPARAARPGEQTVFEPRRSSPFDGVSERGGIPACALPIVDVDREMRLWLGAEEFLVLHPGRAHTDGDLIGYFPERRLLVAGDVVLNGYWPRVDPSAGGDLLALGTALDVLLGLPFDKVVPGHGDLGGREVVQTQRAFLRALEEDVRGARAAGLSEPEATQRVVLRPEFVHLQPLPGETFPQQVRLMYRALVEAAMKPAP